VQLSANSSPRAEGASTPPARRRYSKNAVTLKYPAVHTLVLAVTLTLRRDTLQQQRLRDRLPAGSILTSGFNSPYFTGHFFCFWSLLDRFGLILVNFCGRFFLFSLFLHFQIRYTRTAEGMLMYCSSENTFKAGQLGSKGCQIWAVCPPCGFGTKPFARLTQMACRAAMSIRKTCYRDSPYSPYTLHSLYSAAICIRGQVLVEGIGSSTNVTLGP
jgi:hypothetical protein